MVYILIIQAAAGKVNIIILFLHITESNQLFAEIIVIEPLHFTEGVQTIHLGQEMVYFCVSNSFSQL